MGGLLTICAAGSVLGPAFWAVMVKLNVSPETTNPPAPVIVTETSTKGTRVVVSVAVLLPVSVSVRLAVIVAVLDTVPEAARSIAQLTV